jgi:hypothetical protein
MIDVTTQILYDHKNAEIKLLQLINACVSHEMRNPLNAIHFQNIAMDEINKEIQMILADDTLKVQQIKNRMTKILTK